MSTFPKEMSRELNTSQMGRASKSIQIRDFASEKNSEGHLSYMKTMKSMQELASHREFYENGYIFPISLGVLLLLLLSLFL